MYWNDLENWGSFWEEINNLQGRLNNAFQSSRSYPGIRLFQKDETAVLQAEIPGISVEDLELNIRENHLILSFERRPEESKEEGRLVRNERPVGRFSRSIRLPFRVEPTGVEASYSKGILTIQLPMAAEDKPRKIAVKAS